MHLKILSFLSAGTLLCVSFSALNAQTTPVASEATAPALSTAEPTLSSALNKLQGRGAEAKITEAITELEALAETGDVDAELALARIYNFGDGVPHDPAKALEHYGKAVALGHYRSLAHQAAIYANVHGEVFPKDYTKAKKLYEEAIEKGVAVGYTGLARLYLHGRGVEQDYAKADELLIQGVMRGRGDALSMLGHMALKGQGRQKDAQAALDYYIAAAERGYAYGYQQAGSLLLEGVEGELEADPLRAVEYLETAAHVGVASAAADLGRLYLHGMGVEVNYALAKEYFEIGAALDKGAESIYNLGELYREGLGVEMDYSVAKNYYEQAETLEYARAQLGLGLLYLNGQSGVLEADAFTAYTYFEEGVRKNVPACYVQLALLKAKGEGCALDPEGAVQLLTQADVGFKRGDAAYHLGELYTSGWWGNPPDPAQAQAAFARAAERGYTPAPDTLQTPTAN